MRRCAVRLAASYYQPETELPRWQRPQASGRVDVTPLPWLPEDDDRDPSVKMTHQEMQDRYGSAPDVRKWVENGSYLPVETVPADMYTYGKEGQQVKGLNIFKDMKPPTIRKTEEYPFIWHFYAGLATPRSENDWEALDDADRTEPEHRVFREFLLRKRYSGMQSLFKRGPPPPRKASGGRGKKS